MWWNVEQILLSIKPLLKNNVIKLQEVNDVIEAKRHLDKKTKFEFYRSNWSDRIEPSLQKQWSKKELGFLEQQNEWFHYFLNSHQPIKGLVLPHLVSFKEFHERQSELMELEEYNVVVLDLTKFGFNGVAETVKELDRLELWDSITVATSEYNTTFLIAILKANPKSQSTWLWLTDVIEHIYIDTIKTNGNLNELLTDILIRGFHKVGLSKDPIIELLNRSKRYIKKFGNPEHEFKTNFFIRGHLNELINEE
jgi:hypothetical protein